MPACPAIEEIVPHRGSMLLIDEILSCEADSIVARATVRREAWYLDETGAMPAWIGIELMAQAAAACGGMEAKRSGLPPRRGMLVGCRTYRAASPSFGGGEVLQVNARRTAAGESGFSIFDCTLTASDGRSLATGTIQVLVQPEGK